MQEERERGKEGKRGDRRGKEVREWAGEGE